MPQTFIVDQAATFQAVAFLGAEPRIEFGTRDKQETTKDGLPRWDVQVVAGFRDNFGKVQNEVIKVGYAGAKNPAESIGMYTPVHLVNFTVGVMEKWGSSMTTVSHPPDIAPANQVDAPNCEGCGSPLEARTHSGGLPKRFHNDACRKRALRASQR
ncbi:hypothetical protein, partial [Micromonospora sp. KC721]|uniref:hypothetical protein n=1 Tax=Micromonospora sp. KC721 TaxID=2530380 RepID=UPI001049B38B